MGVQKIASPPGGGRSCGVSLCEIKIEIEASEANRVDELLQEHGDSGWSVLEDVLVRRAWIVGVFESETEAREAWRAIAALTGISVEPAYRTLADEDWRDSYKAHFKAWQFGRLHWVPVWEREAFQLLPGDAVLWLDPGLAFGTGNHETTRLCVERLVTASETLPRSARIIDAGCGSGILALSAALLGFEQIEAFDNDAEAVRVSEENAALNGLIGRVNFQTGDLVTGLAGRQAEVLLANILADVLMRFADRLVAAVAPGGMLVLSGILAQERDQVARVFAEAAPDWAQESRVLGEWSDVVLRRPIAP